MKWYTYCEVDGISILTNKMPNLVYMNWVTSHMLHFVCIYEETMCAGRVVADLCENTCAMYCVCLPVKCGELIVNLF